MLLIARIIGLSLLAAGLGAGLAYAIPGCFGQNDDRRLIALILACVGGIIGAIAGATREIVIAQRQPPSS